MGIITYTEYMQNRRLSMDPATCVPLLEVIAKAESNGNYNAYFGNAANSSVEFTKMSIAQVLEWQAAFVQAGNVSSAVGKYQIIDTTLTSLVQQLKIDTSQLFNQSMQDKLAIALLEKRGAKEYVNRQITRKQFTANLAKEWAGLPKATGPNPNNSYYAGDGLNKSRVSVREVMRAIEPISPKQ